MSTSATTVPRPRLLLTSAWHRLGSTYVRLPPHLGLDTATEIAGDDNTDLPGFWARVAVDAEGRVSIAGDRIGSIPIFYFASGSTLIVGDDATQVAQEAGVADSICEEALLEYLHGGYVQGSGTLFNHVHRREAGEALTFTREAQGWVSARSFAPAIERPNSGPSVDFSERLLLLDAALRRAAERIAQSRRDQVLWIPLSGGLDSRIVTYYLRDACPGSVRAFTYGREDSRDVAGARSAAKSMGVPWHRIASNTPVAMSAGTRGLLDRIIDSNHLTTAMPYLQDWPHLIPEFPGAEVVRGGIICPGHSGDVPTGEMNYLPLRSAKTVAQAADRISAHHMSLWPQLLTRNVRQRLSSRTQATLLRYGLQDSSAHVAGDLWNANNRQSKWLVNSVRGFEAFASSWWMPLWDVDFVNYWKQVPLGLTRGRALYRDFVNWRLGGDPTPPKAPSRNPVNDIRRDVYDVARAASKSPLTLLRAPTVLRRRLRYRGSMAEVRLDASGVGRAVLGAIPTGASSTLQSMNSIVCLFALSRLRYLGVVSAEDFGPHREVLATLDGIERALSWHK